MKKELVDMFRRVNLKTLFFSFFPVYLTAFLGGIFTSSQVNSDWYQSVRLSITPPNWVFPLVWNILFFLIALSLYLSLTKTNDKIARTKIRLAFGVNLFLNLSWSFLFFYSQNPVFALFDLALLWISILFMIYVTWGVSKISSYLLIPYSMWIGFAGILNYLIVFG